MTENHQKYQYVVYDYVYYNFGFKKAKIQKNLKFLGSNILFMIYLYVMEKITKKLKITSKFKHLPLEEE